MENVVFNIGCTTKNGVEMDVESMINAIGERTDCTITRTVGFYKGQRENSLKVDVYDVHSDTAVDMAIRFARLFHQECVALTIKGKTHFITGDMPDSDFFDVVIDFENNIINNKGE